MDTVSHRSKTLQSFGGSAPPSPCNREGRGEEKISWHITSIVRSTNSPHPYPLRGAEMDTVSHRSKTLQSFGGFAPPSPCNGEGWGEEKISWHIISIVRSTNSPHPYPLREAERDTVSHRSKTLQSFGGFAPPSPCNGEGRGEEKIIFSY